MKAVNRLPDQFRPAGTLDLTKNIRLLWTIQIVGLVLLAVGAYIFWQLAYRVHPEAERVISLGSLLGRGGNNGVVISLPAAWITGALAALVMMVVLHEAVPGIFFWLFSGRRPRFGFKGMYAFAALPPDVYLPRGPYLIVGAAPLIILTILGVAFLPVIPAWALPGWMFFLVGNFSGSAGDLYVLYWLLQKSPRALIQDYGDVMTVFVPE
jgi:hypothetical protein